MSQETSAQPDVSVGSTAWWKLQMRQHLTQAYQQAGDTDAEAVVAALMMQLEQAATDDDPDADPAPMLRVEIAPSEQQKFERFSDMNTMLVFMAGCAIRERMALVLNYRAKALAGLRSAQFLLPDEEAIVRDYCRLIALCEQPTPEDVQSGFEFTVSRVFSET